MIRTDKGTASAGQTIKDFGKSVNIKRLNGASYTHTPKRLMERGIKTLKDYLRRNREEGYNIKEVLKNDH